MPANDTVISFSSYAAERDYQDAVEQAQIAAGWYFDLVTRNAKAEFNATMETLRGTVGPKWDRAREAALAKWQADTAEANKLFEQSVEEFLANGELSEATDDAWTELQQREAVKHAMAAE